MITRRKVKKSEHEAEINEKGSVTEVRSRTKEKEK